MKKSTSVERDFAKAMVRYFAVSSLIVWHIKKIDLQVNFFCLREELVAWVNMCGCCLDLEKH